MPPSAAATSRTPTTFVSQPTWKWSKKPWKACITPAVRLRSLPGMTQLIASAGRMKISRTRPVAATIERGYSLPGERSAETCTPFISMPA